ncbi:hypothetical protein BBW65_03470 [Helicobacter enhydrae]|uniref:Uncharacterized protein n=1 Tax=Helicobacter enhydrae TaxID=222136 RepID=A0A1B1U5F1_9HELI|nr:hypothetical protein BBW65_03470 [Helicobacter enhydrae]
MTSLLSHFLEDSCNLFDLGHSKFVKIFNIGAKDYTIQNTQKVGVSEDIWQIAQNNKYFTNVNNI